MTNNFVLDTNVLLNSNKFLEEFKGKIIIPSIVLDELENQKTRDGYIGYAARKAIRQLKENPDGYDFYNIESTGDNDMDIITSAEANNAILFTDDIVMQHRAKAKGVKVEDYIPSGSDEMYSGVKYLDLDLTKTEDEIFLANLYSGKAENDLELKYNQYLIVNDINKPVFKKREFVGYEVIDKFKYTFNGFSKIKYYTINNLYSGEIKPLNVEQELLFDALYSPSTVVACTGNFGTGKTYNLINYSLQELKKGNINKIVYVPNNSQVGNTRELGILPGNVFEKELPFLAVFVDYLGSADELKRFVDNDNIEVMPMSVARGRNIENSIILVNECENLTADHIKLLLGRVGKGSRIFFDGDIKQTDSYVFREKNGLKLLTKLKDHRTYSQMFNMVRLKSIERSETAQMSAYLDEL